MGGFALRIRKYSTANSEKYKKSHKHRKIAVALEDAHL